MSRLTALGIATIVETPRGFLVRVPDALADEMENVDVLTPGVGFHYRACCTTREAAMAAARLLGGDA